MNYKESQKLSLLKIEKARVILNIELSNKFITESDILKLLTVNEDYGFGYKNNRFDYKSNVLRSIYNSPFVLCDQDNLSLSIKKILPEFLKVRYNCEIEELEFLLNNGDISQDEFLDQKKLLKFCYYESSNDGINILKIGKIKNKIKVKH